MSTIKSSDEHLTLNADGTSKDIKLQSNASEKVIIKSDGNVGLGTSSPDSSLEIYKASTAELMIGSDNGGTAQISLYENNSTTKEATIKYDGFANNLVIGTSGEANAIVIPRDSGNVGIGTSPSYKLHTLIGAGEANGVGILNTSGQGLNIYTDSTAANADVSIDQGASGAAIIFRQNSTERMRIASTQLLIGATAAAGISNSNSNYGLALSGSGQITSGTNNDTNAIFNMSNGSNEHHVLFRSDGTTTGYISTSGSSVAYNTGSDYRLKENVDYTWDATTRLKQLKPARFNFIADDTNTLVDGFIAHEVQDIVPEAISGAKDAVDSDGNIDPQGIDQSKLVPLLVKTIQELEARITELENA